MYHYIPAGMTPYTDTALYVTEKRTGVLSCDYQEHDWGAVIKFPDREIVAVRNPKKRRLADASYDYMVSLSLHNYTSVLRGHLPWALVSAHAVLEQYPSIDKPRRRWLHTGAKIFADSGGAQIATGAAQSRVDPLDIIGWMNKCADVGTFVDVPPLWYDYGNDEAFAQYIEITRRNGRLMLEKKRSDLRLLSIVQGYDLDDSRLWAHELALDGRAGWGAGSTHASNKMARLRNILIPFLEIDTEEQRKTFHYHTFAVSGANRIPVMAWMGRYIPNYTSDSTLWAQGMMSRRLSYFTEDCRLESKYMGELSKDPPGGVLPSSNPVARAVKYTDYFKLPAKSGAQLAVGLYNIFELAAYVDYWNRNAAELSFEEYRSLLDGGGSKMARRVEKAATRRGTDVEVPKLGRAIADLDYVETAFQHGLDAAEHRHAKHTGLDRQQASKREPLFGFANPNEDLHVQVVRYKGSIIGYIQYDWEIAELGDSSMDKAKFEYKDEIMKRRDLDRKRRLLESRGEKGDSVNSANAKYATVSTMSSRLAHITRWYLPKMHAKQAVEDFKKKKAAWTPDAMRAHSVETRKQLKATIGTKRKATKDAA